MGNKGWILLAAAALAAWGIIGREPQQQTLAEFTPAATTRTEPTQTSPATVELPAVVRETGLIIQSTVEYEGVFWEDGTDAPVTGVMGLLVYNPGTSGIRRAELAIEQGKRLLHFDITWLPPGGRVLVLERNRQAYSPEALTACRCLSVEKADWTGTSLVSVTEAGGDGLLLENLTDGELTSVTLRYKLYDGESGVYLGGITYQITAEPLSPEGTLQVRPYRYVSGYSRVVMVEAETGQSAVEHRG